MVVVSIERKLKDKRLAGTINAAYDISSYVEDLINESNRDISDVMAGLLITFNRLSLFIERNDNKDEANKYIEKALKKCDEYSEE